MFKFRNNNTTGSSIACDGPCPFLLNDYNYYWMYDVDDLLNAAYVYVAIPYAHGIWDIPYDRPSSTNDSQPGLHTILGGMIDDNAGTLHIALEDAGKVSDMIFDH